MCGLAQYKTTIKANKSTLESSNNKEWYNDVPKMNEWMYVKLL